MQFMFDFSNFAGFLRARLAALEQKLRNAHALTSDSSQVAACIARATDRLVQIPALEGPPVANIAAVSAHLGSGVAKIAEDCISEYKRLHEEEVLHKDKQHRKIG